MYFGNKFGFTSIFDKSFVKGVWVGNMFGARLGNMFGARLGNVVSSAFFIGTSLTVYYNCERIIEYFCPVPPKKIDFSTLYEYKDISVLNELEFIDLSDEYVDSLKDVYIRDETPDGDVVMYYNNETATFDYYSNRSIQYKYLETVARLYVIKNNCGKLFVVMWDELKKGRDEMKKPKADVVVSPADSVNSLFATIKSYKPKKPAFLITERSNTYRRSGTLEEHNLKINPPPVQKKIKMTFAEYKAAHTDNDIDLSYHSDTADSHNSSTNHLTASSSSE
jgi:hypothetical protein